MKLTPDWSRIRKRSLYVASPLYANSQIFGFSSSMMQLLALCLRQGVRFGSKCIGCDSLVPRARNSLVAHFLESDCTDFLFIDSDITFDPEDALSLLAYDEPIIGGVYPRKQLDWNRIAEAARAGVPPDQLAKYGYIPVANFDPGDFRLDELMPVHHTGTGFLRIRREVFEKLIATNPDAAFNYGDDEQRFREGKTGYDLFPIGPDTRFPTSSGHRKYLSEDYAFCEIARAAGFKIHIAPWIKLVHSGYHDFYGDMSVLDETSMSADAAPVKEVLSAPSAPSSEVSLATLP